MAKHGNVLEGSPADAVSNLAVRILFENQNGERVAQEFPLESSFERILTSFDPCAVSTAANVLWVLRVEPPCCHGTPGDNAQTDDTVRACSTSQPKNTCTTWAILRICLALATIAAYLAAGAAVLYAIEANPEREHNELLQRQYNDLTDEMESVYLSPEWYDYKSLGKQSLPPPPLPGEHEAKEPSGDAQESTSDEDRGDKAPTPPPQEKGKAPPPPPPGRRLQLASGSSTQGPRGDEAMNEYLEGLKEYGGKSCTINIANSTATVHWTWDGSLFFAMTLISTIGFGTFAPNTVAGKAFSVGYSLVGIVLFGFCLSVIASNLWVPFFRLIFDDLIHCKKRPRSRRWAVIQCFLTLAGFMLLSSVVVMFRDSWSFGESLYFMWISFSTIGLGDYAPEPSGPGGVWPVILHTIFGLSLAAALLQHMTQALEFVDEKVQSAIDADGDGSITFDELRLFSSRTFCSSEVPAADGTPEGASSIPQQFEDQGAESDSDTLDTLRL